MVSPSDVQRVVRELRAARERVLLARSTDALLSTLAATVELWLTADSPFRKRAERELPATTGFSPAMIQHGLPSMLAPLRGDAIGRLLDAEMRNRDVSGPSLIVHVLSGNIPALAATPILLSLAIKAGALVKASHGDPIFPSLIVQSLAAVDEELARCVATLSWPGGQRGVEAAAFDAADLVVASGNDATIADIARRAPNRFIGHGHRISFAVITSDALRDTDVIARQLADDITLWDQHGCLSPQLAYVERGTTQESEQFVGTLGRELDRLAVELPLRKLTLDDQAAIQRFRQEAEWRAARGENVILHASPSALNWTIVCDADPTFRPTPLNRTIWLKPIDRLSELPALLAPARAALEAAGIAAPGARSGELTRVLTKSGVHRVCPLGEMQHPDLMWRQGGRPRVAEWVSR